MVGRNSLDHFGGSSLWRGPAAETDLQTGDIIVEVAGRAVNTPADAWTKLTRARNGQRYCP